MFAVHVLVGHIVSMEHRVYAQVAPFHQPTLLLALHALQVPTAFLVLVSVPYVLLVAFAPIAAHKYCAHVAPILLQVAHRVLYAPTA